MSKIIKKNTHLTATTLPVLLFAIGYSQFALAQSAPPEIINAETGSPVAFLQVEWNIEDFETVNCQVETYGAQFGTGNPDPVWFSSAGGGFLLDSYRIEFSPDYTYRAEKTVGVEGVSTETGIWQLINGQFAFTCPADGCQFTNINGTDAPRIDTPQNVPVGDQESFARYAAHLGGGEIAFYRDESSRMRCSTSGRGFILNSLPSPAVGECTVETPTGEDNCDYSNADSHDGWGWNPVSGQSCLPLNTPIISADSSDCDYSNAEVNGGWGWNPILTESCAPL